MNNQLNQWRESIWQSLIGVHDKNTQPTSNRRKLPHHKKVNIEKYTAITTLNGGRLKAFLQRSGAKQGCMLSPLLLNTGLKFYTETFSRKIN